MNKKKLSILLLGVLIAGLTRAQQKHRINPSAKASVVAVQGPNYKTKAEETYKNINRYFTDRKTGLYFETTDTVHRENIHSWLWPLCALVQAANEMERLHPGKKYMEPVIKAIDQYYNKKKPAAYQDYVTAERLSSRFYDDNQWIAIAYLDAYRRNRKPKYLQVAKMIYTFMMSGADQQAGGGLYWKEGDHSTKNTCSNGPAILVALELYKATKEQRYLKTAKEVYNWTSKTLQSEDGLFYDNIKIPSLKLDKAFYTYNAGTMLQSNVLLYEITKDKKYLIEAQKIAGAAKDYFYKKDRLPSHYWFNAVMLRGYVALYQVDHNKNWIDFYKQDALQIWEKERDEQGLLGKKDKKSLIDQAGMAEIYARLALLSSKN